MLLNKIIIVVLCLLLTQSSRVTSFDKLTNIFWTIQVSDIHISRYEDLSRATDLRSLLRQLQSIVKPELVFITGDLTDSMAKNGLESMQNEEEWMTYKEVLTSSGLWYSSKVLDVRGNHDLFGINRKDQFQDFFLRYGVQGRRNLSSYSVTLNKSFGKYGFVMVDMGPLRGSRYPFNYFGEVTKELAKQIQTVANEVRGANQTIWLGHYPTSTVFSPSFNLRHYLGKHAFAFLCGHLHTLHGLLPRMYTNQPEGYLELELGDWRKGRYYRLMAIDHDLVSFVDSQYPTSDKESLWPMVLVTNPKDARFLMPDKEPVKIISQSQYIRILAWSNETVTNVSVWLQEQYLGQAKQAADESGNTVGSPLYVLKWDPSTVTGVQMLRVEVTDRSGNKRTIKQPISTDGVPKRDFSHMAYFVLRSHHTSNLLIVFYVSWLFIFLLLLAPLSCTEDCFLKCGIRSSFCRGFYRFTRHPALTGPVIFYLIYELFGPIFLGFLIPKNFGAVFSFGIVVDKVLVLETLTFFYELLQIWTFFFLVVIPACAYADQPDTRRAKCVSRIPIGLAICTVIFTILQVFFIVFTIAIPIGITAFALGIGRFLPLAISWYLAIRVPRWP